MGKTISEMELSMYREFYFTRPIFLASVSYINNLHILTIKTSASSSSTYEREKKSNICKISNQHFPTIVTAIKRAFTH